MIVLIAALMIASGPAVAADFFGPGYPGYRAAISYKAKEGDPYRWEVFGWFKTLADCRVHAHARQQAMILTGELYGGDVFCQYYEKKGAKPKLLR